MSTEIPEYGQDEMAHPLPRTTIVDRIPWLVEQCRGKRVIHVGFADAGFREEQGRAGSWLHGHLAEVATSLVGLDFDGPGVQAALDGGFAAHLVDCTDPAAVAALALEPADVVLAGEVIEHLGAPGPFLEAMAQLCAPGGTLIVSETIAAIVSATASTAPPTTPGDTRSFASRNRKRRPDSTPRTQKRFDTSAIEERT